MSAGLGIIISNVGAISEIINDQNGFLIEPSNKSQLRNAIIEYIQNDKLLAKHKKMNFELSKNYSFDVFKINLLNIIKE